MYKAAGVDVEAGDKLVDWLMLNVSHKAESDSKARGKASDRLVSGIGGFASLFRAEFGGMKSPCLVSSTDGVGTKVKLAADFQKYEGIGQDLVAMCVNDLACVGAEPLFFLDYYASGKLNLKAAKIFLTGVKEACDESGCILIGGETAEMPGVYQKKDFDCAGFVVGVVDEAAALGAHKVKPGDRLLAIASSGFHSNGYSLLRKVFARDIKKWISKLMTPTMLYPKIVRKLISEHPESIHAAAHITGGGLENLMRVVPKNCSLNLLPWSVPPEFLEVKKRAKMSWPDLLKTLNCGIGFVLVVEEKSNYALQKSLTAEGFQAFDLGEVVNDTKNKWTLDYKAMEARQ